MELNCDPIFNILKYQYFLNTEYNDWSHFIDNLNIGIIYKEGLYIITDEKKWLISKLKYNL
jgi:hypothetical protein